MCLEEVYSDEDMNHIIEGLPEVAPQVVEVFKVALVRSNAHTPIYSRTFKNELFSGIGSAKQCLIKDSPVSYWSGYHCYINKNEAESWNDFQNRHRNPTEILTVLVKKEWITAIGSDSYSHKDLTLIASQAFFPTYPETEVKLGDFLIWLKKNEPKYANMAV